MRIHLLSTFILQLVCAGLRRPATRRPTDRYQLDQYEYVYGEEEQSASMVTVWEDEQGNLIYYQQDPEYIYADDQGAEEYEYHRGRTHALAAISKRRQTGKRQPTTTKRQHQKHEETTEETEENEVVEGDPGFLKRLGQFRSGLFDEGDRMERIVDQLLAQPAEAHLTRQPVAKWLPVECKVLQLHLKKERVIHSGRRNTVYEMVDPETGKRYAYKTFQKPDEYTAEINFNMFSRHPFIAKAVCIQPLEDQAGIVFELVDGMSSMSYVRRSETTHLDLVRISAQLLLAMEYVHWLGFVHADLKPENVMIDRSGNIKVIDFGFAIPLPFFKTNRGTPTTIAPELVQAVNGPVHEGIDWWAYASTLGIWHGLHSRSASTKSRKFVPVRVDRSEGITFGKIPADFPDDLRQIMFVGLTPNPDRRRFNTRRQLDFLKKMPYFRKFVWPEADLY